MRRKTVLIVEDDPDIRFTIQSVLEEAGYAVWTAASGDEALHKIDVLAEGKYPGAMITDQVMPGTSGIELIEKIRSRPHCATIPTIIMTASNVPIDIEGVPVIRKPFNLDEFIALVDNFYAEEDWNEQT